MPIAMSINGPYLSLLRIFPAAQPATNPTIIHDRKYIHFSLTNPRIAFRQAVYLTSVFRRSLLVSQTAPMHSQGYKPTQSVLPHTVFIPYNSRSAVRINASIL